MILIPPLANPNGVELFRTILTHLESHTSQKGVIEKERCAPARLHAAPSFFFQFKFLESRTRVFGPLITSTPQTASAPS